ncbi:hypothetical protein J1605_010737 [Eschrichtius robustus]|uniref:Uncharacterized protein n=1 Tax=Eschrichtius robustus TaxID=9764 RepID=A0AB34GR51_ESCRO|nr:hypothetical protein J1605_010737 [Eschrichtius robustus]
MSRDPVEEEGKMCDQEEEKRIRRNTNWLLERTIRSAVEQHLLDVNSSGGQSSEDSESGTSPASFSTSTKQRRRQSEEQDEVRHGSDV